MSQECKIFEQILYNQVLTIPEWHTFSSVLFDAGICSVNALIAINEGTLNNLKIPQGPLDLLKDFQKQLKYVGERARDTKGFSQPLSANSIIQDYAFVPCFSPIDYIRDIPTMTDKENQIKTAIKKVNSAGTGHLTRHQAIMIALYCQEGRNQDVSFYYILNRALRKRTDDFLSFRPSFYLLDSGLRSLPPVNSTTWRGQNRAPDLNKFIVGEVLCFTGICSTTEDKSATLAFMEKAPPRGIVHSRTLFRLNMKQGYSIQQWSSMSHEQEIVAGFCSRWQVLKVDFNHLEDFEYVENYLCDVYIELQQLDYEPLFDITTDPICGLHLLSKIDTSQLPMIPRDDFKLQFVDLFNSLMNNQARNILLNKLGDLWNIEENRFRGDVTDSEAMESVVNNMLMPAQELRIYLTRNDTFVRKCLIICQRNEIYCPLQLLRGEENEELTTEKLQELGFSAEDSEKIHNNDGNRKILQCLYAAVSGLKGDSENPCNFKQWLADGHMKHYVWRDGMMMGIFQAIQSFFNSAVCCQTDVPGCQEVCRVVCKKSGVIIQRGDIFIFTAIACIHLSNYLIQWWYGDISFRQLLKSIFVTTSSMALGFCAGAIAVMFGPIGMMGVLLSLGAGALVGGTSEVLIRKLVECMFPDGDVEETNAKRLLYHKALKALNCGEDSSCHEVQTQYRQLAQSYYPKRNQNRGPRDTKNDDMEAFNRIVVAYEVIQTYRSTLDAACQRLNIPRSTLSKEMLANWNKFHRKSIPDCVEVQKSYTILHTHLNYTKNDLAWLRKKLNIHNVAQLSFTSSHDFYKQPRPVSTFSTLLKGLIRWLVHIHYNPKAITKTECSTLILNKREPVLRCMTAN